jgi:LuxR family maltose regulon positive regulatory protein
LCAAVTGRADSARVLDEIERANLFLTPLDADHRWLRYHQLFRDILLHELNRTAAAEIPALHRRAARWYEQSGDLHQAIRHAVAAGDRPLTANLIATAWRPTFNAGQLRTVESWLGGLPEEAVTADPRLTTARLWLAMDSGRLDAVEVELRRIEAAGPVTGDAGLIRALHTFKTGDVTGAAARLAGIEPGGDAFDLTVRSLLIGVTALWQGAPDRAAAALDEAIRLADLDRNRLAGIYATGCRALVAVLEGMPDAATDRLADAQALIEQAGDRHFVAAFPALARARLALLSENWSTAADAADEAIRLADRGAGRIEQAAVTITAARAHRLASPAGPAAADGLVARARAIVRRCVDPGPMVLAWLAAEPAAAAPIGDGQPPLTDREIAILALLPGPMTQRDLAAALFVSPNTLKTHLRSIYRKLGAQSRADAVLRARRSGLL